MNPLKEQITGCVLAGGEGRRLDGMDKGLVTIGERPLIALCIEKLQPQVAEIIISANRNHARYQQFAPTVFADTYGDYAGPLAGFLAAMNASERPYIATVACDSPFVPTNLVARLAAAFDTDLYDVAVARSGSQIQPVFTLLRTDLHDSLLEFLNLGERKITVWLKRHRVIEVDFENASDFENINDTSDLNAARERLTR